MLRLEQIINIIKQNDKPYIVLRRVERFKLYNAGTYKLENISKDAPIEEKKEKAIEWLTSYLGNWTEKTVFQIDLKTSENANATGIATFEFVINEDVQPENVKPQEQMQLSGYVHESEIRAREAELKAEFEKKLFERKFAELENKLNEQLGAVKQEATSNIVKSISDNIVEAVKLFKGFSNENENLSGVDKQKEVVKPDIRRIEVDKLADFLYNKNVPIPVLKRIEQIVLNTEKEQTKITNEQKQQTDE